MRAVALKDGKNNPIPNVPTSNPRMVPMVTTVEGLGIAEYGVNMPIVTETKTIPIESLNSRQPLRFFFNGSAIPKVPDYLPVY